MHCRRCAHVHQVSATLASRVVFDDVGMTCPVGSGFVDKFGGLYGSTAYPCESAFCIAYEPGANLVLASSLEFSCSLCDLDTYSLVGGSSNGTSGTGADDSSDFVCYPCPNGATCVNGSVKANAGYWGSGDAGGVVRITLCPGGYCCDGDKWPCTTESSCGGYREGPLCGNCIPGYVASLGSAQCTKVSRCPSEQGYVWIAIICGVFASAVVNLVVVSGVWSSEDSFPKAKMKMAMYFSQVR
jgi:hypothetical protein